VRRLLLAVAVVAAAGCGGGDETEEPAASPAAKDRGQAVWVAQGCGSCHSLEAGGSTSDIGPDLDETLKGKPDEYVHESIVAPNAKTAPGFEPGLMPEDYAERISPDDLRALVQWLTVDG
jgi:mono/diheme cytochrome c family protein